MVTNRDLARVGYENGAPAGVSAGDSWAAGADPADIRAAAARWCEAGHGYLVLLLGAVGECRWRQEAAGAIRQGSEQLHALVRELGQLHARAATAERERDRRRGDLRRLLGERERAWQEREDVADALTRAMNKRLGRLRPRQA
jgi:hypothetical protein